MGMVLYPAFHPVNRAKTARKGLETERSSRISRILGNKVATFLQTAMNGATLFRLVFNKFGKSLTFMPRSFRPDFLAKW